MDGSSLMVLMIIVGIIVYFIPTVVAFARARVNRRDILHESISRLVIYRLGSSAHMGGKGT